jgi:preprotein translocase subunit YajC
MIHFLIAQTTPSPQQGPSIMPHFLILMFLIFLVMYLLVMRPQRKKERQRKEMLSQIKKNAKVMTIGGVYGVVTQVKPDEVVLKVDENADVRMHFSRSSIAKIIVEEEGELPKK